MIKGIIKKTAYRIAPRLASGLDKFLYFSKEAKRLREKSGKQEALEDIIDEVFSCPCFCPIQKKFEILQLLKILKKIRPKHLCEIGGAKGGTLHLFSEAAELDAKILSIDRNYTIPQKLAFRTFAKSKQQITCLTADSHSSQTLYKVRQWLGDEKLDFLFIDGDHSLSGVSSDYKMYAPLVRQNGIVAFHDIAPDFKTKYGILTKFDVGQVPAFWNSLKNKCLKTQEIIEDPGQDGFGIGVLEWTGTDPS